MTPSRSASRSPAWIYLAALAAIWIVMSAAAGIVGDFPLNDDWIYGGATRSILLDGSFRIPGPTIANVISQAYWGVLFCLPFGFSYTALRISTLTLGLFGLWALFALVRENGGSPRAAMIGSLTLAVYPLYFGPAASFMTDVPFVAAALISLLFLARYVRTASPMALLLGTLACLATVLVRQVGLAIPLGFAIIGAVRHRRRFLPGLLPLVLSAAAHVIYQRWLITSGRGPEVYFSGIAELIPASPVAFVINSGRFTLLALPYFGLAMLPALLLGGLPAPDGVRPAVWRWVCLVGGFAGLVVFAGLWFKGDRLPVLGNVLLDSGLGPLTQRDTYFLQANLPVTSRGMAAFWTAATALGVAGGVAFLLRAAADAWNFVRRLASGTLTPANWLGGFIILVAGIYWCMMLLLLNRYGYFFDRYVLPMVAFGAVLASLGPGRSTRPRTFAAWAMIICTGLISVAFTHDYLAWNRARWTVLAALTGPGHISPRQIDGGYEFNGSRLYDPAYSKSPDKSYWWVTDDEYLLASGPLPGYREVARQSVDAWLPIGVPFVVALRRF